jgi:hypothetical protein
MMMMRLTFEVMMLLMIIILNHSLMSVPKFHVIVPIWMSFSCHL